MQHSTGTAGVRKDVMHVYVRVVRRGEGGRGSSPGLVFSRNLYDLKDKPIFYRPDRYSASKRY